MPRMPHDAHKKDTGEIKKSGNQIITLIGYFSWLVSFIVDLSSVPVTGQFFFSQLKSIKPEQYCVHVIYPLETSTSDYTIQLQSY